MKPLYLTLILCLFAFFQVTSQTTIPPVDSPLYEQMKANGTLRQALLPADTRTDEQKEKDLKVQLAKMKKESPNMYVSGNEKLVKLNSNDPHIRAPQPNPSGCGAFVPCGSGGGSNVYTLNPCDDCSSAALPLPFNFCFYGTNETQVYLNNNGNLSFSGMQPSFVPVPFPAVGYDMIAPFWADVQTNCAFPAGSVCSETTNSHFIVTWTGVTVFFCDGTLFNSFQVILTDGSDPILPAGNNIGMNYGQMQWTTGTASGGSGGFGGSAAIVGLNQGNGVGFTQVGGFDSPGTTFFSSTATNNQVGWLTNKTFYFNVCNAALNIPPICSTLNNCDTVRVCGLNDTAIVDAFFLSPELGQTTHVTVNLNGLAGATVLPIVPGNTCDAQVQIIGSGLNAGYHVITFTAWDNGIPVDTTIINATIYIDTSTVSQLNPVITGVLALCGGGSTTLTVNPTNYDSYLWNTGSTNTSISVSTAGYYSVHCVLQSCQATVGVNVVVHPLPTPVITGPLITACGTGTTTLTCDSLIYASYLWSNGSTTSSITVGAGTYSLTVIDAFGCTATSAPVTVTSQPAPTILAHNDTTFCSGSANLWVTFTGSGLPSTCGTTTSGPCASTTPYTIGNGTAAAFTQYPTPFTGFWDNGRIQMLYTAAELTTAGFAGGKINSLAFNVLQLNSSIPYNGFTIQMGCTNLASLSTFQTGLTMVYGPSAYSPTMGWNVFNFTNAYEWDGVSNIIVEACYNNSSWSGTDELSKTPTGFNSVIMQYQDLGVGCTFTTPSTYMDRPDIRFEACNTFQNPANFNYVWTSFPTGGGIANATAQNTTATPTLAMTDYQIQVTNINGGCSAIDTVHVGLINIATMHIDPAGPFCTASPLDTLTVSVPLGTGAFSGPGITDTYLGVFDPAIAGVGTWTIHYITNGICGTADTTITIVVANTLDPTIAPIPPLCTSYNSIQLTAATSGGSWSGYGITDTINGTFDPTLPGLVGNINIVTYTIYQPCYSRDTAMVNVTQQVDATINPLGGPYCIDALPVQFTSLGAGGTWAGPGMSSSGLFSPSLAGAGTHTIFHYLTAFCGDTASATVTVIALPVISFTSDITSGCEPTTVQFTSSTDQPGGNYYWNFYDGNASSSQNPLHTFLHYNGGVPFSVSLTYTNTNGCVDSVTHAGMITIYSQPHAVFTATPQPTDVTSPEIHFHDHSTGVIDTWSWTFGNAGAGSAIQNPSYIYPDSGSYVVQLIVTNNLGPCVDTVTHIIVIDPILTCYIPNAFSPNDENGTNDEFRLSGTNILNDGFSMQIFDRWGERVFYSNDANVGWNGRKSNAGQVLELGVYVYKINLADWKGVTHEYIGHVTLLK